MKRSQIKRSTKHMRKRSPKREAYIASDEFQQALAFMGKVKDLPCCACGKPGPSEAHHCTGAGMARDDWHTIPLCQPCHLRYHARKASWVSDNGPDYGFIEQTQKAILGRVRCDTLSTLESLPSSLD